VSFHDPEPWSLTMNLLVTAGNTQVPIDKVRCLTNIFTGRTGTRIALDAHGRGHTVTLLTSHPDVVDQLAASASLSERWSVRRYQTFEDLQQLMQELILGQRFEAVIHSAAVSDYLSAGVYGPALGSQFHEADGTWTSDGTAPPMLVDRRAGKVKSNEQELWLRLVRAPKLIDAVRRDWGFRGVLVKFKLEVGVTEPELLAIAEKSRQHSDADLMAANTLEGAPFWAYLGPLAGGYQRLARRDLSPRLLDAVEQLHTARHIFRE
jgi:phosphopantothenate---cysteine ligase (CTP)